MYEYNPTYSASCVVGDVTPGKRDRSHIVSTNIGSGPQSNKDWQNLTKVSGPCPMGFSAHASVVTYINLPNTSHKS